MLARNNFSGGVYSFYQAENDLFGLVVNDDSYSESTRSQHDLLPPTPGWWSSTLRIICRSGRYITLLGGMRFSNLPCRLQ